MAVRIRGFLHQMFFSWRCNPALNPWCLKEEKGRDATTQRMEQIRGGREGATLQEEKRVFNAASGDGRVDEGKER